MLLRTSTYLLEARIVLLSICDIWSELKNKGLTLNFFDSCDRSYANPILSDRGNVAGTETSEPIKVRNIFRQHMRSDKQELVGLVCASDRTRRCSSHLLIGYEVYVS